MQKHFKRSKSVNKISGHKKVSANSVQSAILDVLWYKSIFNYPVNLHHIYTLCSHKVNLDLLSLSSGIKNLVESGLVKVVKGRYILKGVKECDWKQRYELSKSLLGVAKTDVEILKKIPWIRLICVTGSLSAFNVDENSDIDILIVTSKNRVWLTRFYVFVLLKVLGRLRTESSVSKNICPNIIIGEDKII